MSTVPGRLVRRRRRPGRLASTGLAALVAAAALVRPANMPLELRTGDPGSGPAHTSRATHAPPGR